jgi:hypothetical protein
MAGDSKTLAQQMGGIARLATPGGHTLPHVYPGERLCLCYRTNGTPER